MKVLGWLLLAGVAVGGIGCRPTPSAQANANTARNRSELQALSGLKLPAGAKILLATGESAHDGTEFKKWIVVSSQKPTLPGKTIGMDDNKTFLESLKQEIPSENIGSPIGPGYGFSSWKNKQGQWNADLVETDRGFYWSLENIVLG